MKYALSGKKKVKYALNVRNMQKMCIKRRRRPAGLELCGENFEVKTQTTSKIPFLTIFDSFLQELFDGLSPLWLRSWQRALGTGIKCEGRAGLIWQKKKSLYS